MNLNPLFTSVLRFVPHHATALGLWELERIPVRPEESGKEIETNPENLIVKPLPDLPILKILSNLDWKNLKNCRLVCSDWDRLLREKYLNEKTICFPISGFADDDNIIQTLYTIFLEGKLKFSTLRCKFQKTYLYSIPSYIRELLMLTWGLECVTRLEIIPADWRTNVGEDRSLSMDPAFVEDILKSLSNVTDLTILEPEKYKDSIVSDNIETLEWDPGHYERLVGDHYILELENLKQIHYSVKMSLRKELWDTLDFLMIGANSFKQLVKFHIELDYSVIWADEEALMNFYGLIGVILKINAGSLKNVHIGTRNVFELDDNLMGESDVWRWWRWRYELTPIKIEDLLETGNWVNSYQKFMRNHMFEILLDTISSNEWKDFGLNILECLTLEFPVPAFPTKEIDLILRPFIQSLRNLKTLKIQPIFGRRSPSGSDYIPLPYLSDIFSNSGRDNFDTPILVSNVVFFSDAITDGVDWTSLQRNSHRSTLDLTLKARKGDFKGHSLHWRNVSWENVTFENSIVVPHLRHLTKLVIHQNKHYPRHKILTIDDSEFQMILRDGKSLQRLILNCDLGNVTPFGYSGLPFGCLSFMRRFYAMYTEPKAHSIRDLKGLSVLCLIGLKGHEEGWTRLTDESELMIANFEFLQNYFSNSDHLKYLILGLDGLTKVRRIDNCGSDISYSYKN